MATFNNGEQVVGCVVVSEEREDGTVEVHAAEGTGNQVKSFAAKKNPDGGGPDYVRA